VYWQGPATTESIKQQVLQGGIMQEAVLPRQLHRHCPGWISVTSSPDAHFACSLAVYCWHMQAARVVAVGMQLQQLPCRRRMTWPSLRSCWGYKRRWRPCRWGTVEYRAAGTVGQGAAGSRTGDQLVFWTLRAQGSLRQTQLPAGCICSSFGQLLGASNTWSCLWCWHSLIPFLGRPPVPASPAIT
jgi:hypothetical protein